MRFDPAQHSVLIDGYEFKDWGDGTDVISFQYNADAGALTVGARGRGVFVANQNRSATLTLKLLQHGPDNRFLNRRAALQRDNLKGFMPMTLTIRDLLNEDRAIGERGYFTTLPGLTRGNAHNETTWVIVFERGNIVLEEGVQ